MRHNERDTLEIEGKQSFDWNHTADKAHTQIITLAERIGITNWLIKNGAQLLGADQYEAGKPRYIDIWHISKREPLFIHYRNDPTTHEQIIRLDSSTATAQELMEDGILSPPKNPPSGKV